MCVYILMRYIEDIYNTISLYIYTLVERSLYVYMLGNRHVLEWFVSNVYI